MPETVPVGARRMEKRVVLFDLGDTLVGYYRRGEFRPILAQCLESAYACLRRLTLPAPPRELDLDAGWAEGHEALDHRVTPLDGRLARIFGVDFSALAAAEREALAEAFLGPIFAIARPYPDTLPTLRALRLAGVRLGIISNTPWGSPAEPWRRELTRHGLAELCEYVGFCVDCGWRKPAVQPFAAALAHFGVPRAECLFVGDDPQWDVAGARAAGLDVVLVDRAGEHRTYPGRRVETLAELI